MVSLDHTGVGRRAASGLDVALFSAALFVSAFLLFSIQPMFAKMVLPKLGGAPAVWSVAMVFFQAVLLLGYAYAHWLTTKLAPRRAVVLHLAVMTGAVFFMPIAVAAGFDHAPESFTALWLVALFAASVGVPFFAVAGNGPLLQAWFGRTGHPHAADPYFLYGASNVGSFVALLSFPFLIEPVIGAEAQAATWMAGFVVLMALIAAAGVRVMNAPDAASVSTVVAAGPAPSVRARATWVALAFVPSALLVAVTAHISTDVAAAPFLWVLPLALFLLTFVVTFQRRPVLRHEWMLTLSAPMVGAVTIMAVVGMALPMAAMVLVHLVTFFVVAMVCHGELVRRRPDAAHLTGFYLWMSFGGVLGGIFAGLAAPVLFDTVLEYPLVLFASLLAHPRLWTAPATEKGRDLAVAAAILAVAGGALALGFNLSDTIQTNIFTVAAVIWGIVTLQRTKPFRHAALLGACLIAFALHKPSGTEAQSIRSFFGVHKTQLDDTGKFRLLVHGTTVHGAERIKNEDGTPYVGRPEPATYYWTGSPLAEALDAARGVQGGPVRVGAIGLGTGSFACHRRPGEAWTYYEIDRHVVDIARDPKLFRFLSACAPDMPVVIGDARLTIAERPDRAYQAIIVDAFSSDAIPVHLMTREALRTYLAKLEPNGLVAFHISNRHMELSRVVAAVAEAEGLVTVATKIAPSKDGAAALNAASIVAVVARSEAALGKLATDGRWDRVRPLPGQRAWTDDYSNIMEPIWRHYVTGDKPFTERQAP